jgi:hypothetical protein
MRFGDSIMLLMGGCSSVLAERLVRNQQVRGSTPRSSSKLVNYDIRARSTRQEKDPTAQRV